MKILAIDSSGMVACVAVVNDDLVMGEYTVNYKKTHSQTLLPMIDTLVSFLELDIKDFDAIAVTTGPGSFTGLRIGVATAKGLAQALDIPIIQVPTLQGLAYNMVSVAKDAYVCPIMDAKRNQVFTGIYRYEECKCTDSNRVFSKQEIVLDQCPMDINELIDLLNEKGKKVIFLGDGIKTYNGIIDANMKVAYEYADIALREQKASFIGSYALELLKQGKTSKPADVKPDYLRLSQAEREYNNRHNIASN